jgi:hypothetical protein
MPDEPCARRKNDSFTLKALILPILHSGETFLLFEPLEGTSVLIVLPWTPEPGCPPSSGTVMGSTTASIGALDAIKQLVTLDEKVQLLTGDKLGFGTFPAYLQSHIELELTGAHIGQKLGVH